MGNNGAGNRLHIYTLGQFQVNSGCAQREIKSSTNKAWDLFKYLLTNRGRAIPDDYIIDIFWAECDADKAKQALYTCVHRLRKLLEPERERYDDCTFIVTRDGLYRFNTQSNYWLDVDQFEQLCSEANHLVQTDPSAARDCYRQALSLYQGEYLPENTYDDWVKAAQVYYSNLYRDATLNYLKLLLVNKGFMEGKTVSEKAISVNPFEEEYHSYYIRFLVALGQEKRAKDHFEQANRKFVEELGFSLEITRQLFNEMRITENREKTIDLVTIQKELIHRETARGAFQCDVGLFNVLCRLEARRVDREGLPFGLATLTLGNSRGVVDLDALRHSRHEMVSVLQTTLRRGDVFTETSESQFSVLFHGVGYQNINRVLRRICDKFKRSDVPIGTTLKIKHKILQPIAKQSSIKGIGN